MKKEKIIKEEPPKTEVELFEELIEREIEDAEEIVYSKSGRAVIELAINDTSDFYSPFSVPNYEYLSNELDDFITETEENIPITKELQLDIYSKTQFTPDREDRAIKTIRRHYADKIATINNKLRRTLLTSLLILSFGILLFSLYVISVYYNAIFAMQAILEISAWVFIWQAVYTFAFERPSVLLQRKRYKRILCAKIKFIYNVQ